MSDWYGWLGWLCLIVSGVIALAVRALRELSRREWQDRCERTSTPERHRDIEEHGEELATSLETLRVLATAAAVGLWTWSAAHDQPAVQWGDVLGRVLLGGTGLLLAVIWLPQAAGSIWGAGLIIKAWPLWRALSRLLAPLAWPGRLGKKALHTASGQAPAPDGEEALEEEIRTMVSEGEREGFLEEEAREMIEGVFNLGDAQVGQIMTPRTEIVSMSVGLSWEEALKFVGEAGHTRIPVYEKSRDDIVGVLHIKDMLGEMSRPLAQRRSLRQLLRNPLLVPETKPVQDLLHEFQRARNHLAVVMDEYGSVSGVVTIEDVLEQIVGEIADEHDEHEAAEVKLVRDGVYEAAARTRIRDLNEQLGLELPEEEDYDTLGGFVFHELGHIPHIGDQITWRNVRLRVTDATRRRIDRVVLEILPKEASATANESS